MTKLLIVESPNKVKKIAGFLGAGWEVLASAGHLRDLPSGDLGVRFFEGRIEPHYEVCKDKEKVVAKLRAAAHRAEVIYLATDPDREGEAIAWHLAQVLGRRRYERVVFRSITAAAVQAGVEQPRDLDQHLVDAQQARRVLDRVVGWLVSPTCRKGAQDPKAISAGRVQSVALRLVVDRERAISGFQAKDYLGLRAHLMVPGKHPSFMADLYSVAGVPIGQNLVEEEAVRAIYLAAAQGPWVVQAVDTKPVTKGPPAPFITSTVQQAASVALGMDPDRTMKALQRLFEEGCITYHRTDSTTLSPEGIEAARAVIRERFPSQYLPQKPNEHGKTGPNAQEAHEAIRPTHPEQGPRPDSSWPEDLAALYELLWERFVASQMTPGQDLVTAVQIGSGGETAFRARGVVVVFPGWRAVSQDRTEEAPDESVPGEEGSDRRLLPPLQRGLRLDLVDQQALQVVAKSTKAPARYSQASLIKELESGGIGRPSTYAAIMSKILAVGYVSQDKKKRLHATETGSRLIEFLALAYRGDFIELEYTREMEAKLDRVSRGEESWERVVYEAAMGLLGKAQQAGLEGNPLGSG